MENTVFERTIRVLS